MALKFEDLASIPAPSRRIDSIKDAVIKYEGLSVPVKVVTLEGGVTGYQTLDRFSKMRNAIVNDNGFMALPESWKVGKAKNNLPHGYWYDSDELSGNNQATVEMLTLS